MSRTLLFSASVRPWLIPRRIAARIPSRCLRIVLPRLTNGSSRLRARRMSSRSIRSVDVLEREAGLEDAADGFLERVGAPDFAAGGLQPGERGGLLFAEVLGSLQKDQRASLKRLAACWSSSWRSSFQ